MTKTPSQPWDSLMRDLRTTRVMTNEAAREAAVVAILVPVAALVSQMATPERILAAERLWSSDLDVPPFDRVFTLLSGPAK